MERGPITMTIDEFLHSEVFLRVLEAVYEEECIQLDEDLLSAVKHSFSPEFLRKMEDLINGKGENLPQYEDSEDE